jgi:hypothetical protein
MCIIRRTFKYTTCFVSLVAQLAGLSYADCPGSHDSSVDCAVVTPPCREGARGASFLGLPRTGQEWCSGNLPIAIQVGPITLYYNSQLIGSTRTNEGFGKGMTLVDRISEEALGISVRSADGGRVLFVPVAQNTWHSQHRHLGDLRTIRRLEAGYEILYDSGDKLEFKKSIALSAEPGSHYFPTRHISTSGLTRDLSYEGNNLVKVSLGHGKSITFEYTESHCGRVVDSDGLAYRLNYKNEYLVGSTDPASRHQVITYSEAFSDKERFITQLLAPPSLLPINFSYFSGGIVKAFGDNTNYSTISYGNSAVTVDSVYNSSGEERSVYVFASLAAGTFVKEIYRGNKDSPNGRGVLIHEIQRDNSTGRVVKTKNLFGEQLEYFYDVEATCSSLNAQTSPVATCVKGSRGSRFVQKLLGPDMLYLPHVTTLYNPAGSVVEVKNYQWLKPGLLKELSATKGEILLRKVSIAYEADLPTRITSRTRESFTYDPQIKGRIKTYTGADGQFTEYWHDSVGRITRVVNDGITTTYSQPAQGMLSTTVTDDGIYTFTTTTDLQSKSRMTETVSTLASTKSHVFVTRMQNMSGTSLVEEQSIVRDGGKMTLKTSTSNGGEGTGASFTTSKREVNGR